MPSQKSQNNWETRYFICEPTINTECEGMECYVSGGQCCMTTNPEFKSPYISLDAIKAITPNVASDLLPRVMKQLRSQKLHAH